MRPIQYILPFLTALLLVLQQPLHTVSHEDFAADCQACTLLNGPQLDNPGAGEFFTFTHYRQPIFPCDSSETPAGLPLLETASSRGPPLSIG